MSKEYINDELLKIISGGKLLDGWDDTLRALMSIYKSKYGDEGIQKVKNMMVISVNDESSPIEAEDLETLYNFIDDNWESITPWNL